MPALTLIDWAKRQGPDNKQAKIVELLSQTNEILDDMVFVEANQPTGHRTTIRTGLPEATWRLLNYGVPPSKSTTAQVTDSIGMLETYSEVDKDLADLNGQKTEFLLSESLSFLESMNQQMAETLIYGDTRVHPQRFTGFSARFNDSKAKNGVNIIDAGGTGSNLTSIWLVVWGENTVHGIYPKGSKVGLQQDHKGQVTLEDANKGKYEGYRTHFQWKNGLTVRDWRYVVRIANVDIAKLKKDPEAPDSLDLPDLLIQAIEKIPNLSLGRPAIYCNQQIRSWMRRQIKNSKNVNISMQEVAGKKVVSFDEIPVRRVDTILATESQVK
ncbi:major capsid protein [Arsenophonus endosymbiont of Crataerina pallida]|uniref:major capsid protein n=1 Tax=Arsenophonus endosymbiont of Crataerina pallida TaxID=3066235 RepID=UPI0030D2315C